MNDPNTEQEVETITLRIEGMNSSRETDQIEKKLRSLTGIKDFNIDIESNRVNVTYYPSHTSLQDIIRSVSETGMKCSPVKNRATRSTWWRDRQQLALYGCGIIILFTFCLLYTSDAADE